MNKAELIRSATGALSKAHLHIHLDYGRGGLLASSEWLDERGESIAIGQCVPRRCLNCPAPMLQRNASRRSLWALSITRWDKLLSDENLEYYHSLMAPWMEFGLLAIPTQPYELDQYTEEIASALNSDEELTLLARSASRYFSQGRCWHQEGKLEKMLWSPTRARWLITRQTWHGRVPFTG